MPWLADSQVPVLALVHRRGKTESPVSDRTELRPRDEVWLASLQDQAEIVAERLKEHGWKRVGGEGSDPA